jgi:hypothetical protein
MRKWLLVELSSAKGQGDPRMADIPIALFRDYVRHILTRPEFPDMAALTKKMGKHNTIVSRPMRPNYQGRGVRAETVRIIREATGVPYPPQLSALMGEEEAGPPKKANGLTLAMMLLDRITAGRLPDLTPQQRAALLQDILDTLDEAARK